MFVAFEQRKIWIDPYKKLSTKEKRSIVGKATGELNRMKMENRLTTALQQLQENGRLITKENLIPLLGISIRHMHRIWKQYEALIKPHREAIANDEQVLLVTPEMQGSFEETLDHIGQETAKGNFQIAPIPCDYVDSDGQIEPWEVVKISLPDGAIKYANIKMYKHLLSTFMPKLQSQTPSLS